MWVRYNILRKGKGVCNMAKNNDVGLFQLDNGNWGFRITVMQNGKRKDTTYHRDDNGNPFKTKTSARLAREQKSQELRQPKQKAPFTDCTLGEMWNYYLEMVAPKKARSTVKKYASIWKNHVSKAFGSKNISDINVVDLELFLQELYNHGYSWKYVESFLKLFYQLFGLAYKAEHIDPLRYTRMFLDKGTKLKMPTISQEDAEEYENIATYNSCEINQINKIFEGGNCYTAFLFGYYCGLRISETFGLMWSDYNWDTHTLTVCRQMTYEDGSFCLRPVKTLKSSREIDVPDVLHQHLIKFNRQHFRKTTEAYRNRKCEIVLDKTKRDIVTKLQGADFINRKDNGELLTINSIKYYAKEIKKQTGIDFQYHSLRKTHLSYLAGKNVPAVEVMNRAGHKKFETTMKYYVNSTEESKKMLLDNINQITTDEIDIEVTDSQGNTKIVKESTYLAMKNVSAVVPH